jgi:hypothetical protein
MNFKLLFSAIFFTFFSWTSFAALNLPTNSLPADKATNQSTGCQIQVKYSGTSATFEAEYSTSSSFTNVIRIKSYYASTIGYFFAKALKFNTTYYWRARARTATDSSGWTNAWSFTTGGSLFNLSPADNSGPYLPGINFNFHRSGDYSNYVFQIDTSKNFNSTALVTRNIEDTFTNYYVEFREKTIKFKTVYYWRVKGVNATDSNRWTPTRKVTTIDSVRIFNPPNGVAAASTNLNISVARDNFINFQYDLDTSINFNTKKYVRLNDSAITANNFFFKNMEFDQTYYWRVRGCAFTDTSRWSKTRKFTVTGMKNKDVMNNGTQIDPNSLLGWNTVDSATAYQFQLDTLSSFNSPFLHDSLKIVDYKRANPYNRSFNFKQLPFQTVYYRVRPMHKTDTGEWSKVETSQIYPKPSTYNPFNNTTNVTVNYKFTWRSYVGVTAYRVQRDISASFNSSELVDTLTTAFDATLPEMKYNTVYYWRVKIMHTKDTSDWSTISKLTTQVAPVLKSPLSYKTSGPGVAGTLVWEKMDGAKFYQIDYDTNSTFKTAALSTNFVVGDSTSLRIKELYFGKLYHWRVRAIKGNDTSSWSAVWFFYTYNPARLNSPANNQVGTTLYSLDWNSINGTTGYHYILASDTNLVNRWEGKEGKDNAFFHYFDKDPTDFNTKYFWKVRVFHAKDTSGWSDIWKFTTRKRNGVKLTYPKVNETAIPLGLIMAWDAFSSATNYTVEYSENSDMSSAVISTVLNPALLVSLKPNTTYYWRVQAKNKDGIAVSDISEIQQFTTAATFAAPVLVSPADKSDKIPTAINLNWNTVRGATYEVQIAEDAAFVLSQISPTASNTTAFSQLKTNQTYYWRVRAKNSYATGPWSNAFNFRTALGASISPTLATQIQVYPNPVNDKLFIVMPEMLKIKRVSMINHLGQVLENWNTENTSELELNITNYPKNVYLIKLETESAVFYEKVIIN